MKCFFKTRFWMGSVYERRLLNIHVQLSNFFQCHKMFLFLSSCSIFVFESHCSYHNLEKKENFTVFEFTGSALTLKFFPSILKKKLGKQFLFFVQQFIGFLLFLKKKTTLWFLRFVWSDMEKKWTWFYLPFTLHLLREIITFMVHNWNHWSWRCLRLLQSQSVPKQNKKTQNATQPNTTKQLNEPPLGT